MKLFARLWEWFGRRKEPKSVGARGEMVAARYLKRRRYIIVARGERDKLGELDLIAIDGHTLVFVEVKTRRSTDKGHPADAVDDAKQRRLTRLALAYLRRHDLLDNPARFDVIAIVWPDNAKKPTSIEHYKNAFEPVGQGQMFS